jgi:Zn-dependent oligopeptidase
MLSQSICFPNSSSAIEERTTEIIKVYEKWHEELVGKIFTTKSEFFQYFEQTELWDLEFECIDFMQYVHPEQTVRDASIESSKKVSAFGNKWSMNVDIYHAISRFHTTFRDEFDVEESLYLTRTLDGYQHKGIHLDEPVRKKLEALNQNMTELSIIYSANLNDLDDHIHFSREELAGVENDFIDTLDMSVDGKYKVTTKYDQVNMIMPYCEVEDTRKRLSILFQHRGKYPYKNHEILQQTLKLRKEKAGLLGYNSYSEYALSHRRMATSPEQVNVFLQNLISKTRDASKRDVKIITDYFNKTEMESWNLAYFTNIYKKEVLKYDQKRVQQYFPLEKLLPNLLGTFEEIFHLRIQECELLDTQTWHSSVKCFSVSDRADTGDGEIIGHFYVDLYPREGKYGHAAAFTIKQAYMVNGTRSTPVSAMVCNFTRPTKEKPSLLTFGEVETFFHELGHIFHQLLSKNRFSMFSGTAVERDFVECPSQALENWCYEDVFLQRISCHYETGESIPVELMQKIKENKYLFSGMHYIRQLLFALYDMKLHSADDDVDVEQSFQILQNDLSPLVHCEGCMAANFGHLMGGYGSGYYGYLWSEVYAAEVFNLFKVSGDIFDRATGLHYRKCILEKGGTETGFHMMEQLLGRVPNSDAFLQQFD